MKNGKTTLPNETLDELNVQLKEMLIDYQWIINDTKNRQKIKKKADKVCEEFKKSGKIYDYKNVMDKSNNTQKLYV